MFKEGFGFIIFFNCAVFIHTYFLKHATQLLMIMFNVITRSNFQNYSRILNHKKFSEIVLCELLTIVMIVPLISMRLYDIEKPMSVFRHVLKGGLYTP